MIQAISEFVTKRHLVILHKEGIPVLQCKDQESGLQFAKDFLLEIVDKATVLFLSGGKTPKELYASFAADANLEPGSVALVDERYDKSMHKNSNEKMLVDTGFLQRLANASIPFYPVLKNDTSREDAALEYDKTIRILLSNFRKSAAVLGVGVDGHTAGIMGNSGSFQNPLFLESSSYAVVSSFRNPKAEQKERITMTFLGLSMVDILLVLVFGKEKKKALNLLFTKGAIEDVPSRFFTKPDIARKTLFITDQKI